MRDDKLEAGVIRLIRAELRRQHVTQTQVAIRAGITPRVMSHRMTGKARFTVVDLYVIGKALGVHPRVFLP